MRVALFHPAFDEVGGAELLAVEQARYLRSRSVDAQLFTLGLNRARWEKRLEGVPCHLVSKRHWSDLFLAWTEAAKLQQRGQRAASQMRDCDVILAHNYPCSAMLGMARVRGRKIWYCHEPPRFLHLRQAYPAMVARMEVGAGPWLDQWSRSYQKQLQAYDRAMAERTGVFVRREWDLQASRGLDEICANSEFTRDNVRRIYGRCGEEVIYPIVHFPGGGPPRCGLRRRGFGVLVHSRLFIYKNIDTVLRGFQVFRRQRAPDAVMHVVGEGDHRPQLERLALELCPPEAIRFHGYLPTAELQAVYQACDVFALLPVDEPFGLVFPEAAAQGLLLIGPDHGGPREILDDGKLGWVVDAFAPEALAEALAAVHALTDAETDRRRAEADRACRARFSADVVGPKLLALLRDS